MNLRALAIAGLVAGLISNVSGMALVWGLAQCAAMAAVAAAVDR